MCVVIVHYSFRMPRFFAGYKLHFFLYLSQFLGTMTCMRRAVLHIRPLRTPKGVPFLPVSAPFLTLTSLVRLVAKRNSPVRNPIFSLIVHAYSCYQSENIYSICLLKSNTIITPLELLVKKFLLTFRYRLSMICL